MKHNKGHEAWDAYRKAMFANLCVSIASLHHEDQDGNETGFSGAGYSLYRSIQSAVDEYCKERQAVEPVVPTIKDPDACVSCARLAENPAISMYDHLVEIDMEARTIDLVDAARVLYTKEDPYFIPFDQLRSVLELFSWIQHLNCRDWFTKEHADQLLARYEFLVRNEVLPCRFYHGNAQENLPCEED